MQYNISYGYIINWRRHKHFVLELGPWSEWTDCSLTCNGGERSRSRVCGLDPSAKSKDNPCKAPLRETEKCNEDKCPVFTEWSSWTDCSKTCGSGKQKRERECVAFSETSRKLFCKGALEQTQVTYLDKSHLSISSINSIFICIRILESTNDVSGLQYKQMSNMDRVEWVDILFVNLWRR